MSVLTSQGRSSRPTRYPILGAVFDLETGLHYNRFRYYDPLIGRYISADPIGQLGGINLYRYAFNNPLRWFDFFGLWTFVNNARGTHLSPNVSGIESTVDSVYNETVGHDAQVTSATDGTHGTSSFHYDGNAVDVRTWDPAAAPGTQLPSAEREELAARLRDALGPDYDVAAEPDHIHIEYDPPGGPPAPSRGPGCYE